MIMIKKKLNWLTRSYVEETYYFIDPDRISDDGAQCRSYLISMWDDKTDHRKASWFPLYGLNMTIYQDVSWLEVLVLFNITKADINRVFRRIDILDQRVR